MTIDTTDSQIAARPSPKGESPVAKFAGFMDRLKPQLAMALPKHMNADRMARLAITAFSTSRDLQECSPTSIAGSIMIAAQMGLEPGIGGQGYLIPYKGTCTFVPGWKGLVDLVARAGRATVWTGIVYPGDRFEYQLGDAPFCRHVPNPDGHDDGAEWTHAYAIGRVRDAQMPVIEVWSRTKVIKHLHQFNKVGGKHYALKGENNLEMYARKVALLQVLKYMPSSIELANAIEITHAAEEGRGAVLDGDFVRLTDPPPPDDAPPPVTAADKAKEALRARAARAAAAAPSPEQQPGGKSLAAYKADIDHATGAEPAALALDEARDYLAPSEHAELAAHFTQRWES